MNVLHTIDKDRKLIITTITAKEVDVKGFIDDFSRYQHKIRSIEEYRDFDELVDFQRVEEINISADDIRQFGNFTANTDFGGHQTKLALLVSTQTAYGLARMYEAYRGMNPNANKTVEVFYDENDAYRWLAGNQKLHSSGQ